LEGRNKAWPATRRGWPRRADDGRSLPRRSPPWPAPAHACAPMAGCAIGGIHPDGNWSRANIPAGQYPRMPNDSTFEYCGQTDHRIAASVSRGANRSTMKALSLTMESNVVRGQNRVNRLAGYSRWELPGGGRSGNDRRSRASPGAARRHDEHPRTLLRARGSSARMRQARGFSRRTGRRGRARPARTGSSRPRARRSDAARLLQLGGVVDRHPLP